MGWREMAWTPNLQILRYRTSRGPGGSSGNTSDSAARRNVHSLFPGEQRAPGEHRAKSRSYRNRGRDAILQVRNPAA